MISSLQAAQWIVITHGSDIAAARRSGQRLAQQLGFCDTRTGQLAIIITEAATNMLKHAGDGKLCLSEVRAGDRRGIDVIAFDKGPGIVNLMQALRDGVSTAGTAGTGLGALRRLSDVFDIYAPRDGGTVCFMRLWGTPLDGPDVGAIDAGAVCLPLAGEDESGDAWALAPLRRGVALLSVDGLGHGPEAALAARAALDTFALQPALAPDLQLAACHTALRPTRGAALAVAVLDGDQLQFAGVGNISACIVDGQTRRQMVSHNGIAGHNMRKAYLYTQPCAPGALVILHSDGIGTQWDLAQYPGLTLCHPAIIAAVLLRDHARLRDDASVLVLRHTVAGGY